MPRIRKEPKFTPVINPIRSTLPWSCTHFGDQSEIEAYVESRGTVEVVADIHTVGDNCATAVADFIVEAVNNYETMREIMADMTATLKLCLTREGLTWEVEHDAEIVMARAERWIK